MTPTGEGAEKMDAEDSVNYSIYKHDIENEDLQDGNEETGGYWSGIYDRNTAYEEPLLLKGTNTTSQIAIVGANLCPIESLDYEIFDNEILKHDWRSREKVDLIQYVVLKWGFALLIGIGTGLFGFFNSFAVENIAGFKLHMTTRLMSKHRYVDAFLAYAGANMCLAAAAAALCAFIAPAAAGSGIPEVKAYLNGINAQHILAPSTLFVKVFGSILGVSAGFVVGKEGPMVHTGACVASLLGQGGSRKYHLNCTWLRYFKNDRDRRDMITCGAAAGVTAAFRAPVGGVLFALEEAASWWRSALLWRTFFTTAVVAIVIRITIQLCATGKCGLFGKGGLILYDVNSSNISYSASDIFAVLLLGAIAGILGSIYNYLVDKVVRRYSIINKKGPFSKISLVVTISILTSCCYYFLPWLAHCIPCPSNSTVICASADESGEFKTFQCPPGYYNDLATLFLSTNDDAIRNLLSPRKMKVFHISSLFIYFVTIYCLGIVTYGIAIPAGLFIPVILAGAAYGRLFGRLFETITELDRGLFALLGAASLLGGTMRMTVSICVILLELTNDLLLLPLVMLVLLVSKSVADSFNKGVYDLILKIKGLPYLEAHAEPYMRNLVTRDVLTGPLVTLSGIEKVGNILHAFSTSGHNGFPVIDEPPFSDSPELCGLVLRSHVLLILKEKLFSRDRGFANQRMVQRISALDFGKAGSGKGIKLEDLDIQDEELDMYVDLHPITNASPYTVVETMSLAKAAILFRLHGLRHMCVVPKSQGRPPVVGILTRHDFMPEHILGLYPHIKAQKLQRGISTTM